MIPHFQSIASVALAVIIVARAFEVQDMGPLPSRQLSEFVIGQQMPVPQDEIKHEVKTADSALVDGRPTTLTCAPVHDLLSNQFALLAPFPTHWFMQAIQNLTMQLLVEIGLDAM
jgi:hypothetical protein